MVSLQREDRRKRQSVRCAKRYFARTGFTVLELVTVIGIVSLLTSLLLPAVGSAREAARRIQCVSQLKQLGLALHNYHDTCGSFPPGWQWESTKVSAYGWAVPLLPYLEEKSIFDGVNRNVLLTNPVNTQSRYTSIGFLLCPSDITEPTFMLQWEDELTDATGPLFDLPTANYFGVFGTYEPDEEDEFDPSYSQKGDGSFIESQSIRLADLKRGTSHVVIVGERTMARVPSTWLGVDRNGEDAQCRLVGNVLTTPNCEQCDECEFASRHPGGSNFLWGDGRVSLVSEKIDSTVYQNSGRRTGN